MSAATTSAVYITVPKYVAITPNTTLPKIRPAPITSTTTTTLTMLKPTGASSPQSSSGYASSTNSGVDEAVPKAKKRRLDHLTWEEKVQRKKLKNRVAAQTSRDRKKARMEEMEYEIKDLNEKTEILENKCESLMSINDSLLAKNQKLDMEVELLRQQLTELKEQTTSANNNKAKNSEAQTTSTSKPIVVQSCAGCASILTGSAAGINGHTVDTQRVDATIEKEQLTGIPLGDCSAMSALQDILLIDDEEFDARRLEELAESLLADITADMEVGNGACNEVATEIAGNSERLSRSVVGTTAECLESSRNRSDGIINVNDNDDDDDNMTNQIFTLQNNCDLKVNGNKHKNTNVASVKINVPTPDTVYGTYDAKTNSITIVMDGDAVPVNEAVEEIYCEGVTPPANDIIKCPTPAASPSQVYLNVVDDNDTDDDDDDDEHGDLLNFDPIAKFLCPKRRLISPLARSPTLSLHSAVSDHGYESIIGSPSPTTTAHFESNVIETPEPISEDFAWQSTFNELFPSLI